MSSSILGDIGNIFIVIIFLQHKQNACAIYLISAAILNSIYITFNRFVQYFPFYYSDETLRAFVLCKIRLYLPSIIGQLAKTMIVFACIDRFMITNNRVIVRAFIIIIGTIPPIIMDIFGYLTCCNMRRVRRRIQPIVRNTIEGNVFLRQRDRDLLIIVIYEIFIYVIAASLYSLILLESLISDYTMLNKSVQYLQTENFLLFLAFLLLTVNSSSSFFIYLSLSKSFREDFKQLILYVYRKLRRSPPIRSIHRINEALVRDTRL
ncbi:unnamed protein product [Adineta steineri]|uniref:G-protein coupled receptors family 1 profile domain-containing protein n=1 Tax=Adineta steineri TaxID=433720 RepID=A0A820FLU5_9BILA|nr:unnamed protein product [Adineta steineri]CAF4265059.1 unnamed protein product [Adineta steineri]